MTVQEIAEELNKLVANEHGDEELYVEGDTLYKTGGVSTESSESGGPYVYIY